MEVPTEQGFVGCWFGQPGYLDGGRSIQQRCQSYYSLEIDQRGQDVESWAEFDDLVSFRPVLARHEEIWSKRDTAVLLDDNHSHDLPGKRLFLCSDQEDFQAGVRAIRDSTGPLQILLMMEAMSSVVAVLEMGCKDRVFAVGSNLDPESLVRWVCNLLSYHGLGDTCQVRPRWRCHVLIEGYHLNCSELNLYLTSS